MGLWTVFLRRKSVVFGILACCIAAAVVLCIFSTRRYRATGELQVQPDSSDALGLESMMGGEGAAAGASDALDANITIQTQAQILQSDELALRVIKQLNLAQNEDFKPKFSPIGWALGFLAPKGPSDPKGVPLEDAPIRRSSLIAVFRKNLTVKPVSGTRLIDVSYLNPDPKVSATVVNHVIDELANYNFQTRYNATQQAAGWLGQQLTDLRTQSENLQAKVVQLQRDSGVFSLGETDTQGREQVYTPVLDRLQQATAQVTQARANRILKGALYEVVKSGDPELISGLANTPMAGAASASTSNSLGLIQSMRTQEATLQGQLNEMSAKFGPAYPKIAESRANLEGIQKAIEAEVGRIGERAKNDVDISQKIEDSAKGVFATEKKQADALNNKAIEYMIVRQEADQSRLLYENLLNKLRQAGVLAGLRSNNITIVDVARTPAKPAKPNVLLYLAASVAGGLFLGSCTALLRDSMDNKIQDLPELEAYLGSTPLGIIPYHKEVKAVEPSPNTALVIGMTPALERLPALNQPRSPYTEAVRALRTSLLLAREGAPPQVILMTSSVSGEGKSMLSLNLAALLAQQSHGKKVLLVDADLRRPILHKRLKVDTSVGLSSILASDELEKTALSTAVPVAGAPGLDILPAGPIPPYPAELLGSQQMRDALRLWRQHYDFIILDGAPLLPVTDSVLLSTAADFTIVVARYKMTERQSLERSCRLVQAQGKNQRVGIVLNAVERSANTYFQYYGYRYSSYYGNEKNA